MVKFVHHGDFRKTERFMRRSLGRDYMSVLRRYGEEGVRLLSLYTPVDTGLTASSWYYEIVEEDGRLIIKWNNSNIRDGWLNIAVILQYGHATRNGGYYAGVDYINPALQPIFESLAEAAWKEVTKA